MADVLITAPRRTGLAHTERAVATCGTLRLELPKIGTVVTKSVRRSSIAMSSACPDAAEFRLAHVRLSHGQHPRRPARQHPRTKPDERRSRHGAARLFIRWSYSLVSERQKPPARHELVSNPGELIGRGAMRAETVVRPDGRTGSRRLPPSQ